MKVALVFAALLIVQATGHLCLLFPHQRGSAQNLATAGSSDCVLLTKECGGRKEEMPRVTFDAGMNTSIVFQKNLDHYDASTPGSFDVSLAKLEDMKFELLLKIPDSATPSLTVYTPNITIPKVQMDHAVLQVTYVTGNPNAPPVFYQCADIMIN